MPYQFLNIYSTLADTHWHCNINCFWGQGDRKPYLVIILVFWCMQYTCVLIGEIPGVDGSAGGGEGGGGQGGVQRGTRPNSH